jgi:glycosyltransferase involved in cell wall biosynthesis
VDVLVDTSYALRGPSGTGTYVEQLVAALPAAGVAVREAADTGRRPPAGGGLGSVRNALRDRWWLHAGLAGKCRKVPGTFRNLVVHHPLPAWSPRIPVPQVVTVHDLAFVRRPEDFDPRWRRVAERAHRQAAARAAAVVVPSRTTAEDLLELWPEVDAAKVLLAPHGADHAPGPSPDQRAEHLLYVGDDEPRKRVRLLREAHARYRDELGGRLPLVLAGRAGEVRGEGELATLLRGAAAVVTASAYEGFGLPLVEALHAGVPVIGLRAPGVEEACGGAALLVDDPAELPAALLRAEDAHWRTRWGTKGVVRAGALRWSASARVHADAYALARDMAGRHGR